MRKGFWKQILLVLLPLVVLALMAAIDPHVRDIGTVIKQMEVPWLLGAAFAMLIYYLMDTLNYMLACRYMSAPQTFGASVVTTMLGFFYSALTPFSSGGQPMQVLQMRRRGMKVGIATSVLILKFLAWQLTVTMLGLLGFVFSSGDVLGSNVSMFVMFCVGFLTYLGTVALGLLVLLRPDFVLRVGKRILNFLANRRILKHSQTIARVNTTFEDTISDVESAVRFAIQHKWGMLLIFLVSVVQAFAYMSVTYLIYRGLGFSEYGIFYVVLLQGLLHIAVSFVPLPGASIASEGGFYLVFDQLLSPAARFPAVVLWRLFTYYSALLIGVVAVAVDGFQQSKSTMIDEINAAPIREIEAEATQATLPEEEPQQRDEPANLE